MKMRVMKIYRKIIVLAKNGTFYFHLALIESDIIPVTMTRKQVPQTVTVADTKNILRDTTDKGDSTPTLLITSTM